MAKIFRKTGNPYVLCGVTHSLTLRKRQNSLSMTAVLPETVKKILKYLLGQACLRFFI